MVEPYLKQPDYTNAMVAGLQARLAYDKLKGSGGFGSVRMGTGGQGPTSTSAGPLGSPEERAARRNQMMQEEANALALDQMGANVDKTVAGTDQTNAMTEQIGKPVPLNALEEEKLRQAKLDMVEKGLQTAVSFVPQVTQDNYGDWRNWVNESNFVPENMFKTEGEVAKMSQVEFKVYKSQLEDLKSLDKKAMELLVKQKTSEQSTKTKEILNYEYGKNNPDFKAQQDEDGKVKGDLKKLTSNFAKTEKLRKEYLSQSKEYQKVRDSFTRVEGSTADPSPAGDLSLIFNYMKMLDPGSVVRESEFATAAATGSYGDRIQAAAKKIASGERLSDDMRADFINKAKELYAGMADQHEKRKQSYADLATENDLDPKQIVMDLSPDPIVPGKKEFTKDDYDKLKPGDTYELNGVKYVKGGK